MASDPSLLCPSAHPDMAGARVFAVVGGTTWVIDTVVFLGLKSTVLEPKPITAKIMSVCASGRYEIFPTPSPSPAPVTPPEPIPIIAWTIWKPDPSASLHGSRKLKTRARRYGST